MQSGRPSRKGVYVCTRKPITRVCESCVAFWSKKCPFCGKYMIHVSAAVLKKQDRDQKRSGV